MISGVICQSSCVLICALMLLDVSAAFNSVYHQTLLRVLSCCFAAADLVHNWRSSYLSNERRFFNASALESSPRSGLQCTSGKGSGPLKFISYTEDFVLLTWSQLSHRLAHHRIAYYWYADDTHLIGSTSISQLLSTIDHLQQCVTVISGWLVCLSKTSVKSFKDWI